MYKETLIESEFPRGTRMCRQNQWRKSLILKQDENRIFILRAIAYMDVRLHGCTPAWMQVVERRREQAAEVVEPRLEPAAERNPGWIYSELP